MTDGAWRPVPRRCTLRPSSGGRDHAGMAGHHHRCRRRGGGGVAAGAGGATHPARCRDRVRGGQRVDGAVADVALDGRRARVDALGGRDRRQCDLQRFLAGVAGAVPRRRRGVPRARAGGRRRGAADRGLPGRHAGDARRGVAVGGGRGKPADAGQFHPAGTDLPGGAARRLVVAAARRTPPARGLHAAVRHLRADRHAAGGVDRRLAVAGLGAGRGDPAVRDGDDPVHPCRAVAPPPCPGGNGRVAAHTARGARSAQRRGCAAGACVAAPARHAAGVPRARTESRRSRPSPRHRRTPAQPPDHPGAG